MRKDLNLLPFKDTETVKLLEENVGEILPDLDLGSACTSLQINYTSIELSKDVNIAKE